MAAGGGPKRRYQYCSDYLGSIIYLRALQGHSGGNLFDLTLQDNVLIGPGIFPYIYHVGSNFSLSSIISNGLIPGCALKKWRNDLNNIQEEKRVTAKSRRMMNLIARTPSHVSSSTSVSPRKRSHGNQNPWSATAEKKEGSGQPVVGVVGSDQKNASDYYHEQSIESSFSTRYSKWDDDRARSSQEWKTETTTYD